MKIQTTLCWLFFLFAQIAIAQDSIVQENEEKKDLLIKVDDSFIKKKEFDADQIEEYKKNDEFIYEIPEEEPSFLERAWVWLKRSVRNLLESIFGKSSPAITIFKFLLDVLPYIIIAISLYLIIKYFSGISIRTVIRGKNTQLIDFKDDEELLQQDNLDFLLQQAIDKGNYRLAIRFYYLLVLQKLSASGDIVWHQEKTNRDFIKELEGKPYQSLFEETTRFYDFVWYGNFVINKERFMKAEGVFTSLINKKLG